MKNILWKQKKLRNGFTIMEVMVAVVIIGILVAIAMTNFIASSKRRALEASLTTNMRTLQVMLETYRVDWQAYPQNLSELGAAATAKNYNKSVANPYTRKSGFVGSTNAWATECYDLDNPPDPAVKITYQGMVCYVPVGPPFPPAKYYLMGYDDNAIPIQRNNKIYLVTNGG
jgi:prepilin-type N-terminal cleavage/methylation domain-containing protein